MLRAEVLPGCLLREQAGARREAAGQEGKHPLHTRTLWPPAPPPRASLGGVEGVGGGDCRAPTRWGH